MTSRLVRLRWARKIMGSKGFLVVTDRESVIALEGMDPRLLRDELALQEQVASIENFLYLLKDLQAEHIKAIDRLRAGKGPQRRNPSKYEEMPFKKKGLKNGRK